AARRPYQERTQMSSLWKRFGWLAVVGLLGCHAAEKPVAETPAPKVDGEKVIIPADAPQKTSLSVETAEPRKLAITHLTGRLLWNDDATVRIFTPVAGRVSAIVATLGQPISAGDPLAKIDSPDFGQARADARKAASDLQLADRTLAREKELQAHGAAPVKDVESAEAVYASAISERDRALARLALYGGDDKGSDELYLLRSPLSGVLVERNVTPGQEVRADMMLANAPNLLAPLFVVSDPTKLWVQLDVSESDISSLQPGQQLRIYSRAYPDKVFEGTLENIGDSLDPTTRTVKVRGIVDNADKLLKAEMYVTVDVTADAIKTAPSSVEISSKAVFMKDNQYYLFIETSPGEYQRQVVKLGTEQDGKVQVFHGVNAGQKVVTEGCLLLQALMDSTDKS
ncbi:MAG: Efflux transporter, family, subunit, partial [Pedosphaera sp.]|nr:Efflux transporter, family, subunit [Pedosphaera sp.]